jgi:hypothetical protein
MALTTRLFFILLMLAAVAALSYQPAGAATDEVAATPELDEVILTPFDLGLAGMAAFPIAGATGDLRSPAELVADAVTAFDATPATARRAFVDSGLQLSYQFDYRLTYPNDPDPAAIAARTVTTTLFRFPDAATAAASFDPIAAVYGRSGDVITPIAAVGDQSRAMTAPKPGQPFPDVTMTFQLGAVIANVTMHDDVGLADAATVLMLAGRLQQRITTMLADRTAGLSELVLYRMGSVG